MKRFMTVCALAVAILGLSQQQASAWKKFGFNIGMNINSESADNSALWGAYRNGPVPGSKGHGQASTITWDKHPKYADQFGGGYNPGYAPGDFGGFDGHSGPAALPAPAPMPQAAAPAYAPTYIPATYWVPAQNNYWPGN